MYSVKLGNRSEARASDLRSYPGLWCNRIKLRLYEGKESEYSPRTCSTGRPAGGTLCPHPLTLQMASSAGLFFFFFSGGENARFQRRSPRPWSEFDDGNRASSAVSVSRGINSAMGYALQTPPPSTMAREPALCALPPRHASRSNIAAVTARRLFTRLCSSPPLPDQAVTVGLRCRTADPQTLFLTTRWRSV